MSNERRNAGEFPAVAINPGTMTEPEITAEIDGINDRLTVLYAARRGMMIPSQRQGHQWAWCEGCGKRMVDSVEGIRLCRICTKLQ